MRKMNDVRERRRDGKEILLSLSPLIKYICSFFYFFIFLCYWFHLVSFRWLFTFTISASTSAKPPSTYRRKLMKQIFICFFIFGFPENYYKQWIQSNVQFISLVSHESERMPFCDLVVLHMNNLEESYYKVVQ